MDTVTCLKVCDNTKRPEPPTIFFRGRRIPVGEPKPGDDGWWWWRRVRRAQKGRLQAHWWHERGGWVIGCDLHEQALPWSTWTIYEDEDGGEWWIETGRIEEVGERFEIQGIPHWFIAEGHWDYKPPSQPKAVQTSLLGV